MTDPRAVAAAAAVLVRLAVSHVAYRGFGPLGWEPNPLLHEPRLDAEYYLAWASDIAGGDVFGTAGVIGGEPFLLNPLYAYVLAPLVGATGGSPVAVMVFQALLAGATAWLAASAARRFAGSSAAWVAGAAVAFSAALVHLDTHVSVSGLAAFLVAGACHALAPGGGRGHGPSAAGVWLGLGALARPVALLAVPFAVWRHARGDDGSWRRGAVVAAVFAALALPCLVRNAAVSGEPVVYTAANGHNLCLGNNPEARRNRAMLTFDFRFAPQQMHEDSKYRAAHALGREPTRAEVSSWYRDRALDEWRSHPGESAAHTGRKLRWFLSPEEPASSADLDYDRSLTPVLWLGFLPTWLLAAAACAGAVAGRRRRELLMGPGALVLAHWAACTLAFPLSHYRSPAIPAMAVLAGVAVAAATDGRRRAALVIGVAAAVGLVGAVGEQPAYVEYAKYVNDAVADTMRAAQSSDAAGRAALAARAADAADRALALEPRAPLALEARWNAALVVEDFDAVRTYVERAVEAAPWNPVYRVRLAEVAFDLGDRDEAMRIMDDVVAAYPWSAGLVRRRDEIRELAGVR